RDGSAAARPDRYGRAMSTDLAHLADDRAAVVTELRALAQRLDDVPLEQVGEAVSLIGQGLQELRGRAAPGFGDRHDAGPREEPVEPAEGAATVELTRHLPDHVALADATFNLVNLVAGRVAETSAGAIPMPLAKQITLVLLVRLGNDLRSITRLGMTGYPL